MLFFTSLVFPFPQITSITLNDKKNRFIIVQGTQVKHEVNCGKVSKEGNSTRQALNQIDKILKFFLLYRSFSLFLFRAGCTFLFVLWLVTKFRIYFFCTVVISSMIFETSNMWVIAIDLGSRPVNSDLQRVHPCAHVKTNRCLKTRGKEKVGVWGKRYMIPPVLPFLFVVTCTPKGAAMSQEICLQGAPSRTVSCQLHTLDWRRWLSNSKHRSQNANMLLTGLTDTMRLQTKKQGTIFFLV